MQHRLVLIAAALTLSACATTQSTAPSPGGVATAPASGPDAFRTSDFAWSTVPGRGQIDGQVAYTAAGVAYGCSQAGVVLTPETPWVRRRMNILYNSTDAATLPAEEVRQRTPPERSQDYSSFVKRTTCDAAGRFSFTGLPDGSWYVITVVRPVGAAAGREMAMMRRVTVRAGKPVQVRL